MIKTAPTPVLPTRPTAGQGPNPKVGTIPTLLPTPTLRPTATPAVSATPVATPTPLASGRNCPALPFQPAPKDANYAVIAGDSLEKIATDHKTTVEMLVATNERYYPTLEERPDCIRTGWQLIVP